ncbi:18544_t:CDS:2, partial [Racocetra fulgida]
RSIPDQRPNIEEVTSNLANINIDNVISIEDDDGNKPDITNILQGLTNGIDLQGLPNGIDLQGLTNGIDADSEILHELYEILSTASSSASNINETLCLVSNLNESSNLSSNINEDSSLKSNINKNSNLSSNINEDS